MQTPTGRTIAWIVIKSKDVPFIDSLWMDRDKAIKRQKELQKQGYETAWEPVAIDEAGLNVPLHLMNWDDPIPGMKKPRSKRKPEDEMHRRARDWDDPTVTPSRVMDWDDLDPFTKWLCRHSR
jgi:hypothetical protein